MNYQLIEKIIKTNSDFCPEFSYENPLLDRNVAKSLSKSYVKMLYLSKENSKINNNLRLSILENIRNICQFQPDGHIKVDDNFTELLVEFHSTNYRRYYDKRTDSINKKLEAFLIRRTEDSQLNSNYKSEVNPEVIQSLVNLNQHGIFDTLSEDIIHWNVTDSKHKRVLKELFANEDASKKLNMFDDISTKMIPEIEKHLIEHSLCILEDKNTVVESSLVHNNFLQQLVKMCLVSTKCFQICIRILNNIFIETNFNTNIQKFISKFINSVQTDCSQVTFSVLYPTHLSHLVVLLDFNEEELQPPLRNAYIQSTIKYLHILYKEQASDLVMLLSHFPRWFDIYFGSKYYTT